MRIALLLHEEHHIGSGFHRDGLSLLREFGEVEVLAMRRGEEGAAHGRFAELLREVDGAVIGCWHRPAYGGGGLAGGEESEGVRGDV